MCEDVRLISEMSKMKLWESIMTPEEALRHIKTLIDGSDYLTDARAMQTSSRALGSWLGRDWQRKATPQAPTGDSQMSRVGW
jgi:hypothetical protein